ncbi:hypothetical protein [Clostridium sp. ZBS2]|uniref:hypothetical protein n=1 Tax=Clostridium sp. ZBS2 TaxID=2949976 RepID=UPI00207ABB4F|nr:hypothetical protein [Clostridium sp. ZBS2]
MFTIEHKILNETLEEIKKMSLNEFVNEFDGDIEGQIKITFNNKTIGYINDEIPFSEELLVWWLTKLNQAIYTLNQNNYVAFYILDTDNIWLELKVNDDLIHVRKIKLKLKNINKSLVDKPMEEFEKYKWEGITVGKNEFIKRVVQDSQLLINEISEINSKLIESESIKNLRKFLYLNINNVVS